MGGRTPLAMMEAARAARLHPETAGAQLAYLPIVSYACLLASMPVGLHADLPVCMLTYLPTSLPTYLLYSLAACPYACPD